nr:YoaK family protein [uncultured Erwinia sp.]
MIPSKDAMEFKEYLRLIAVTASGAMTEVVCYADAGHMYAGIMTGNTVQLGWLFWAGEWAKVIPLLLVIMCFAMGCVISQILRCKHVSITSIYGLMLILLLAASFLRLHSSLRVWLEMPVLSFTVAIQAVAFPRFDSVGLQTVVTTNNIVKFTTGLVSYYIYPSIDKEKRPLAADVWIPGVCWFTFIISAGMGGWLVKNTNSPLIGSILIISIFFGLSVCLRRRRDSFL